MRRISPLYFLVPVALGIAACQTQQPQRVVELPPRPQGIEGRWLSTGGPVSYTASFSGGRFVSTENGTGAVLADGAYRVTGPGQVRIDYASSVSGQQIAANCNQAGDRISCASSNGSRFDLVRQG